MKSALEAGCRVSIQPLRAKAARLETNSLRPANSLSSYMNCKDQTQPPIATLSPAKTPLYRARGRVKPKIWIDLENSPHVPFFAPIIDELRKHGCSVFLTARDCFQVRELTELFHLGCQMVGRHYGKGNLRKMAGLCVRALKLIPRVRKEMPDLAVSHGSRSQLIACSALGIPSVFFRDYEFSTPLPLVRPAWLMCPQVIPSATLQCDFRRILKYPGIKEDVYVPRFVPDPGIRQQLGLDDEDVVATLRPPANEAHYHHPQSAELFGATVEFLSKFQNVKLVVLPRNERQAVGLKNRWPRLFASGAMRIPERVVDGLNLIWFSDLVISGGGTMNREAAALRVPVYSVFRGNIGAVDRYLSEQGRLVLLETIQDVHTKIRVARRSRPLHPLKGAGSTLSTIVEQLTVIAERNAPLAEEAKSAAFPSMISASDRGAEPFDPARSAK
jgi:predicted glycosyltransferase